MASGITQLGSDEVGSGATSMIGASTTSSARPPAKAEVAVTVAMAAERRYFFLLSSF